jgi:glycosyltransferase involved in cell wall biosynthesis
MPQTDPTRTPLVILNQYYMPDVASTGHLLHELAHELAGDAPARSAAPDLPGAPGPGRGAGFDVSVITTRPSYGPRETWQPVKLHEVVDGVEVRRLLTTRFNKNNLLGRLLNSVTFIVPLTIRVLLTSRRRDVHLYTTNPPFLGIIGAFVSLFRRHTYVMLLHDAYPQMAVWVGTIRKGGFIERTWHWFNRLTYTRAAHTIVLCEAAKSLLCRTYGVAPARVHVIPNWADRDKLFPIPKADSSFAKANGLVEPFTVLYSGNLGLYYEFETLLQAAALLKDENFRMVFVGSGGRRAWIEEQIKARNLTNTLLLPYQPFEKLNDSLCACDASFVTIAKGIEGISFPSKLYSALAVGRPVLALSEEGSELKHLVEDQGVGLWFALGDAAGLADGIRRLMRDRALAAEQGRQARAVFERNYTREAAAARYAHVLRLADPRIPERQTISFVPETRPR